LRNILHLGRIADEARQQPDELALILDNQQFECRLVTTLRTLDQLLVDFPIPHGSVS
jgi:hypothetical protein